MATKRNTLFFLVTLSALMALTSLSTDIYLPALPLMSRTLGGDAALTITGFLIGFAIAQLVWGPVSDRIGRRLPLFLGMLLFVAGSVGCALAQSLPTVVFWRVFQELGACVGPMLSRAMVRDLFGTTRAAQVLSSLAMIMVVAPLVGPLVGGLLLKVASWHAHFWLLAAIGVLMFVAVSRLPETLPPGGGLALVGVRPLSRVARSPRLYALYLLRDVFLCRRLRLYCRFAFCLY